MPQVLARFAMEVLTSHAGEVLTRFAMEVLSSHASSVNKICHGFD